MPSRSPRKSRDARLPTVSVNSFPKANRRAIIAFPSHFAIWVEPVCSQKASQKASMPSQPTIRGGQRCSCESALHPLGFIWGMAKSLACEHSDRVGDRRSHNRHTGFVDPGRLLTPAKSSIPDPAEAVDMDRGLAGPSRYRPTAPSGRLLLRRCSRVPCRRGAVAHIPSDKRSPRDACASARRSAPSSRRAFRGRHRSTNADWPVPRSTPALNSSVRASSTIAAVSGKDRPGALLSDDKAGQNELLVIFWDALQWQL